MVIVILKHGPYDFDGIVKYRDQRFNGLRRLLAGAGIPFEEQKLPFWNRFLAEIEGHIVYICKLTNMEFDSDGNDFHSVIAFEVIKDAYLAIERYCNEEEENESKILFDQNTGEKCYSMTFDSFFLESFSTYQRSDDAEHKESILRFSKQKKWKPEI